jgi:hypothetical protein
VIVIRKGGNRFIPIVPFQLARLEGEKNGAVGCTVGWVEPRRGSSDRRIRQGNNYQANPKFFIAYAEKDMFVYIGGLGTALQEPTPNPLPGSLAVLAGKGLRVTPLRAGEGPGVR